MSEWRRLEHHGRSLRLELRTRATPQQVWDAWADPEQTARWFVDEARGEARVGGTITWAFDKFGYVVPYEVKDAVPGERFALGGQLPGRPPFLLEVTIARDGGETLVTLVNSGFLDGGQWDDEYEGIHSGWQLALVLLKHYLEHHPGHARATFLAMVPAAFGYDALLPRLASAEGLRSWLADAAEFGAPGERCSILLKDGGTITGRVLVVTRREVAISWDETGGVLEMKGFAFGAKGERVVALRGTFWDTPREQVDAHERRLRPALDRLAGQLQAEHSSRATSEPKKK